MKEFKEYLSSGIVKKQSTNKQRALSIIEGVERTDLFLSTTLKSIPREKWYSNFIVDQCYDILLESIRAIMFLDGFNSGTSHEAEISYLRALPFSEKEIRFLDEIRYCRNGIKYYGTHLPLDYALKVLSFKESVYPTLKKIARGKL